VNVFRLASNVHNRAIARRSLIRRSGVYRKSEARNRRQLAAPGERIGVSGLIAARVPPGKSGVALGRESR
jgi:hypothetical protein